jgi:SNF2 family DNA or RNA helicase
MLNFRRIKKDFSPAILKEGQSFYQNKMVESVKVITLTAQILQLSCRIRGAFENSYECEIEIDLQESTVMDSNCDCPYEFDCQHLAAVLFYLEDHIDAIIVSYAKEANLDEIDEEEKETVKETIKEAKNKEVVRKDLKQQKELLDEYLSASAVLGQSPFFLPEEEIEHDKADLAAIFNLQPHKESGKSETVEIQLALRLPFRSKPLNVPDIHEFLNSIKYKEPLYVSNKRYFFSLDSFHSESARLVELLMTMMRAPDRKDPEANTRTIELSSEDFGTILSEIHAIAIAKNSVNTTRCTEEEEYLELPCLYSFTMEEPLLFSKGNAILQFELEYLEAPAPKLLINPTIKLNEEIYTLEKVKTFECAKPGLIIDNRYYRFDPNIKRKHLKDLELLRSITIPEPLFGTFVENSLPEMLRFVEIKDKEVIESFVTLPPMEEVSAECDISYLNGELEATVQFVYGNIKVPSASSHVKNDHILQFVTEQGILARDLCEEQKILEDLFQGFLYDPTLGTYTAKTDKKIVEFMTEVIPRNQDKVQFLCPENLLDQFIYNETNFILKLKESDRIDMYEIDIKTEGYLNGVSINALWECLSSKKAFIELANKKGENRGKAKGGQGSGGLHKILVLDLDVVGPLVKLFDELGITMLDDHKEQRPLWSLANITPEHFDGLPVKFSMSKRLKEIQQQMLGTKEIVVRDVPKEIKAELRKYQIEGANWLERLRNMHLNGILADDMGLGKTLQAIIVLTQNKIDNPKSCSLVVSPTSLVYNWKEELSKFNPKLKTLIVDGTPTQRKKLIEGINDYDVILTSYSLLQKDIEHYQAHKFAFCILDEAQHIKNRSTRNAKSVKIINAAHRLILTGTPIENSLDELWSLFDFLMPGLLSTYDRFVEKYIRSPSKEKTQNLEALKLKVAPFILRRMKKDVLEDLPPVSEIIYHCHLSDTQRELYKSYAESARKELSSLVEKEGFDKVQIHILATLTRLKQICCHPAIFAKEHPEAGDSSKYEMLRELLQNLMEGGHKTVVFSQYTRMLNIMSKDLKKQGIPFEYLDGSTKNRLDIVKRFNEDATTPIFLISLKAGGVGLNLTGADSVILFDNWWNPAVDDQAVDRLHRIGQQNNVSSYKLVTLNTIEEKIMELQSRKKGLVKKVINTDEEAISKLTWEEVLELLQS